MAMTMISVVALLTLGLTGTVYGLLYAVVGEGPQRRIVEFKSCWDVKDALGKAGFHWPNLRFDRARNALEVLALPERVFRRHLTTAQIVDILINPRLKYLTLRSNTFFKKVASKKRSSTSKVGGEKLFKKSIRRAIGRRLGFFRQRLPEVNLTTVSGREQANQVVEAISPQAYEHMSPLMAITSPRFQTTLKNIAHLFGLTLRVLRVAVPHLIPIILGIIQQILSTLHGETRKESESPSATPTVPKWIGINDTKFNTPALRPLHVASLLLGLLEKYPILGTLVGDRVNLLVKELQDLMASVRMRLSNITQKMIKFRALRTKRLSHPQREIGSDDEREETKFSPTFRGRGGAGKAVFTPKRYTKTSQLGRPLIQQ